MDYRKFREKIREITNESDRDNVDRLEHNHLDSLYQKYNGNYEGELRVNINPKSISFVNESDNPDVAFGFDFID